MNFLNRKTVEDIDVTGKRVLVRCDYNVPFDSEGNITDTKRIDESIKTLRYLIDHNAKVIICSHRGRPKGTVKPELSLAPTIPYLSKVLGQQVQMATDVVGESAKALCSNLQEGQVMMLENVRFEKGEEANDPAFANELASLADIYVNDAFGTSHRAHASTAGVAAYLPAVCGYLIQKELQVLGNALNHPARPFVAILGGAKVSDKIGVITALLDNYIYQTRNTCEGLKEIKWKRVLDVNDRSLRNIVSGLGGSANGVPTETGFDITPASEIMAILCLATDIEDLKRRVGNILLGYTNEDKPFTVNDLGIAGAITVLLKDALLPNLVQTTENTPAFVHGGPFANIAHGCNSISATQMALTYGDYVITEAGFGADLGAEKFFNIKCRKAGLSPKLTVIVATAQSLKLHGGVPEKEIKEPNIEGLKNGFANLDKHIENMKSFGQQVIVTFNRFATDTDEEIALVAEHCEEKGVGFAMNNVFAEGGEGGTELARLVVDTIENHPSAPLQYTYDLNDPIRTKVQKVAQKIYGASSIVYTTLADKKLRQIESLGISHYPICIAKTQYSFSSDPKAYGVAKDFELKVRDVIINNGAEMIVVVMGEIMRMPGLPKEPQARKIDIVDGMIEGLS